jgi:hypothetical protein
MLEARTDDLSAKRDGDSASEQVGSSEHRERRSDAAAGTPSIGTGNEREQGGYATGTHLGRLSEAFGNARVSTAGATAKPERNGLCEIACGFAASGAFRGAPQ